MEDGAKGGAMPTARATHEPSPDGLGHSVGVPIADRPSTLPWKVRRRSSREAGLIAARSLPGGRAQHVAGALFTEDAVYAARACNAFPSMLDALFKARHRLLKEGFEPSDPTVRSVNAAIELAQGTEARSAETAGLGPKDDGPVADKPCAQTNPERN